MDNSRFSEQIAALESFEVETGRVILYGSSFFAVWGHERAKEQLAELGVVCNGFGGSVCKEQLEYYDRLVKPYKPRAVVLRCGENDHHFGVSGNAACALTLELADRIHADFPDIKTVALLRFGCPYTEAQSDDFKRDLSEYNSALELGAKERAYMETLDLTPLFSDGSGGFKPIFSDGLHLTDEGYSRLAPEFILKIKELI